MPSANIVNINVYQNCRTLVPVQVDCAGVRASVEGAMVPLRDQQPPAASLARVQGVEARVGGAEEDGGHLHHQRGGQEEEAPGPCTLHLETLFNSMSYTLCTDCFRHLTTQHM